MKLTLLHDVCYCAQEEVGHVECVRGNQLGGGGCTNREQC